MHALWSEIYGNARAVEVEIGSGTGTFLLAAAAQRPATNFFGIEHSYGRVRHVQALLDARDLPNTRILCADAACVVARLIPDDSVTAYHAYFPDPWWKRRHHRRRLFTTDFVAALARTLAPGGQLFIATDVDDTFALMVEVLTANAALTPDATLRSPRATSTSFERKGLARGATIKEATFVKQSAAHPHVSNAAPITPAASPS